MDATMTSYVDTNGNNVFDFEVIDGVCPIIPEGDAEDLQHAQTVAFLDLNSIPQLVGNPHGNDWIGLLTQKVPFGELDAQIRTSLMNVGLSDTYYPYYSMDNEKLKLTIRKSS
jgi:hypothetical protein